MLLSPGSSTVPSGSIDQTTLVRLARQGGQQAARAKEDLIAAYGPLCAKEVHRALSSMGRGAEVFIEDAWQGAKLGLLEATLRFDPTRGASFGSFARKFVTGGIWDAIKGIAQFDGDPLDNHHLRASEDNWVSGGEDPEPTSFGVIAGFVAALPLRQQQVVRLMYDSNLSQAEVARSLGVSRMAVSKIHSKVIDRGRSDPDLASLALARRVD